MSTGKEWTTLNSLHVMRNRVRGRKDPLEQQVAALISSMNNLVAQRDDAMRQLSLAYGEIRTLKEEHEMSTGAQIAQRTAA